MTDESVLAVPEGQESRVPWLFVPNMELKCLEFKKVEPMYPVNCEQALEVEFLKVEGSLHEEEFVATHATSKSKNKFRGPIVDDMFELTYRFEKPILIRGYILETANVEGECDPKDWKINCRNIETNFEHDIHTVEGEEARERWIEKEYRINDDLGDVWTDRISIRISATQGSTDSCHFN